MERHVGITLETIFERGTPDEQQMMFYTEGVMKEHRDSYTYSYDESAIFQTEGQIIGMLEFGADFVTRSISGEESYVMHFKEGHREQLIYQTPDGTFLTEIKTLRLEMDLKDGLGRVAILYKISFARSEEMTTEVRITVKDLP